MTSSATLVRTALNNWLSGLGLSAAPSVVTSPPPGEKEELPRAAAWFRAVRAPKIGRKTIFLDGATGLEVVHRGTREADLVFRFWCTEDQAETIREEFEARAFFSARGSRADDHTAAQGADDVLVMPITAYGHTDEAKVYLGGDSMLADPVATQRVGLWVLDFNALLTFPLIIQSPAAPAVMDICLQLEGQIYHLSDGPDPISEITEAA